MVTQVGRYTVEWFDDEVLVTPLSNRTKLKQPTRFNKHDNRIGKLPRYLQSHLWRRWQYVGYVYLLHFDKPYKHARHYLGFTKDIPLRELRHRAGNGANLLKYVESWQLARVWVGDRYLERRLKKHSSTRYCPICNPNAMSQMAQPLMDKKILPQYKTPKPTLDYWEGF